MDSVIKASLISLPSPEPCGSNMVIIYDMAPGLGGCWGGGEPGQPLRLVYSCCWVALSAVRDQLVARAQMSRFFLHALIHRSRRGGVAVSSLRRVSHCLSRNSLKDQGGRTFKAFCQLRVSRSTPSRRRGRHISNSTFHQVSAAGGVTGTARDSRDPTRGPFPHTGSVSPRRRRWP